MSYKKKLLVAVLAALFAAPVMAQTDTPTHTPTETPTNTPTSTPTHTFTPDKRLTTPIAEIAKPKRRELLSEFDPALKQASLGEWVEASEKELSRLGASVRQAVVPGINGGTPTALSQPIRVGRVISILAITTSSGAAATQLLLLEGESEDYTVAAGIITIRSNQSANTLIITYEPSS